MGNHRSIVVYSLDIGCCKVPVGPECVEAWVQGGVHIDPFAGDISPGFFGHGFNSPDVYFSRKFVERGFCYQHICQIFYFIPEFPHFIGPVSFCHECKINAYSRVACSINPWRSYIQRFFLPDVKIAGIDYSLIKLWEASVSFPHAQDKAYLIPGEGHCGDFVKASINCIRFSSCLPFLEEGAEPAGINKLVFGWIEHFISEVSVVEGICQVLPRPGKEWFLFHPYRINDSFFTVACKHEIDTKYIFCEKFFVNRLSLHR